MYNNISWDSVSGYLTYTMDEIPEDGRLTAGRIFVKDGFRESSDEYEMSFNLDILGDYGTTFKGPYAITMSPEGGGTIGWNGNLIVSSESLVDLREITTTDNLVLLRETVDGTTQHIYSSASADDIFLSSGTTIVSATYGDFIEGVVGSISTLDFMQVSTSAVTVVLAETDLITTVSFEDGESLSMRNVNHLLLNGADDSYAAGNSLPNMIYVWSDSSTVEGKGGDDDLTSFGDGNWLEGDDGNDFLTEHGYEGYLGGGKGDDTLISFGDYCLLGGDEGNDLLVNYGTVGYLNGGAGDDRLLNYAYNVTLTGGDGNDVLENYGDASVLYGGVGDDILITRGLNTQAGGGVGNDTITSYGYHEALKGHAGDDLLISYGPEGRLVGGHGYDSYEAHGPGAQIYGSAPDGEVASFAHFGDRLTVVIFLAQVEEKDFMTEGVQATIIFDTGQTLTQQYFRFNNVTGTGGDDMIGGNDQDNILNGGGGRDIIEGHGGNDTITVERIGDIDGGVGWDSLLITGNDGTVFGGLHGLHNIEELEIAGDYTLFLDSTDIIRTTDDNNTLVLKGDSNDSLFLLNSAANFVSDLAGYDMYVGQDFKIYVDEDIHVSFVGVPPMEQHP